MNATTIEWTDRTWNPATGCTRVSPGCDRCYAETIARRFSGSAAFPNGFTVTLHPERLDAPRRWRRPARVFVNSMSDLFHADIPDDFVLAVFQTMADTPQHTYQVLTKRHARMRAFCNRLGFREPTRAEAAAGHHLIAYLGSHPFDVAPWDTSSLPNVWLGVSAESHYHAQLRIPALLETPAAVRFVSAEPLLAGMNLIKLATGHGESGTLLDALRGDHTDIDEEYLIRQGPALDWVIIGGESGPGARRMSLHWAQFLVQLCADAGTPVFVKQLGSHWAKANGGPSKGQDMSLWPEELRVRHMPVAAIPATVGGEQ